MRVIADPEEVVKRTIMRFLNEEHECVLEENVPRMQVGGKTIGPFELGTPVKLPNWIIEKFMTKGIVKSQEIDNLHRFKQTETRTPIMEKPPSFAYTILMRYLQRLENEKSTHGTDPRIESKMDNARSTLEGLLEMRIPKLLRYTTNTEALNKMTIEEQWLVKNLTGMIVSWKTAITKRDIFL